MAGSRTFPWPTLALLGAMAAAPAACAQDLLRLSLPGSGTDILAAGAGQAEDKPTPTGPTILPVPLVEERTIWISPRTTHPFTVVPVTAGKETAFIVTGGVKLLVKFASGSIRSLEVEADQVVIWQKGEDSTGAFNAMRGAGGSQGAEKIEFYLTGNVVIRYGAPGDVTRTGVQRQSRTLRADRVYYDVANHRAIAVKADLEYTKEGFINAGHVVAEEIHQIGETEWAAVMAEMHASRLPSDPGIKVAVDEASIYREPRTARRGLFGIPIRDRITGQIAEEEPEILEATGISAIVRDIPVFYWPRVRTNVNDPFGPFEGLTFRQDRQFGFQVYATWDMLELIGLTKLEHERWNLLTDYLSRRGPALGTNYSLNGQTFFGMDAPFRTLIKGYMIYDQGTDILGSPREADFVPPAFRGRFMFRHQQEFGQEWSLQTQFAYLSDRNFYEEYYNYDFLHGPNQETFAWLKYQSGNAACTFLFEPDMKRDGVSETYWLPRVDGYLLGQSIFERFTYHSWASVAYARLDPFRNPPREFPLFRDNGVPPPEVPVNTGRVDWMQQISMPFELGPAKVVPYGVLDLAYYTQNNEGAQQGRVYGGGGVRASVPLSKLYHGVESELCNLQGLYHKNLFSANYFIAGSTTSWAILPQLDRLNDDATEAAWRDVLPWEVTFPQTANLNGVALERAPQFNPRLYVIRRLIDSKPDTLDDIQVVQLDWRQKLQTKRGYPGLEHVVDWLTLDLSASIFPAADRDNFGSTVAFIESRLQWNIGDRNGIFSNVWVDPFDFGARFWELGTYFSRDDRTSFNISYRSADPLQSRVVAVASTYVFSPKYAFTAVTAYDFGYQSSLTNSFLFTRVGTDMQVTIGFTYNYLINNIGFTLNIVPNLIANQTTPVPARGYGLAGAGTGQYQGR